MKTEATVTKRAVPSMLTVAPIGITNFPILLSIPALSRHWRATGRVVALVCMMVRKSLLCCIIQTYVDAVAKAVIHAWNMMVQNLKGFFRTKMK